MAKLNLIQNFCYYNMHFWENRISFRVENAITSVYKMAEFNI